MVRIAAALAFSSCDHQISVINIKPPEYEQQLTSFSSFLALLFAKYLIAPKEENMLNN